MSYNGAIIKEERNMNELTESKFAMWRVAIGILHLDGNVSLEEEAWFNEKLKNIRFSQQQKEILLSDFKKNLDIDPILKEVTDPKDRAFLLHLTRTLGHLDGDYSQNEKSFYDNLRAKVMKGFDLNSIENKLAGESFDFPEEDSSNDSLLKKGLDFIFNLIN